MEVVSGDNWTTGAVSRAKLQSDHHHQQTNIQFFYRLPNQQCQSSEGKNIRFHGHSWTDAIDLAQNRPLWTLVSDQWCYALVVVQAGDDDDGLSYPKLTRGSSNFVSDH